MTGDRKAKARALHERVGFDPAAAVELLSLVADCFDAGECPPAQTRVWFAKAVRAMAGVEPSEDGEQPVEHMRATKLATELGIVKRPGPPSKFVSRTDVRRLVQSYGDVSETKLSRAVAEAYGVSVGTARDRVKAAKRDVAEAEAWFDSVLAANDLETLVEPRGGECVRRNGQNST